MFAGEAQPELRESVEDFKDRVFLRGDASNDGLPFLLPLMSSARQQGALRVHAMLRLLTRSARCGAAMQVLLPGALLALRKRRRQLVAAALVRHRDRRRLRHGAFPERVLSRPPTGFRTPSTSPSLQRVRVSIRFERRLDSLRMAPLRLPQPRPARRRGLLVPRGDAAVPRPDAHPRGFHVSPVSPPGAAASLRGPAAGAEHCRRAGAVPQRCDLASGRRAAIAARRGRHRHGENRPDFGHAESAVRRRAVRFGTASRRASGNGSDVAAAVRRLRDAHAAPAGMGAAAGGQRAPRGGGDAAVDGRGARSLARSALSALSLDVCARWYRH